VRPALKPGLLPVWRDRDTLQIGIDSRRAVALAGMAGAAPLISLLDGSRDRAQVIQAAAARGVPEEITEKVLSLLAMAGVLDDFPAATLRLLPLPVRARLAAELATASLARRDGDGGARTLARRLEAQVRIHGGGKVAADLAGLLTASGIGSVTGMDPAGEAAAPGTAQPRPDRPTPNQLRPNQLRPDQSRLTEPEPARPKLSGSPVPAGTSRRAATQAQGRRADAAGTSRRAATQAQGRRASAAGTSRRAATRPRARQASAVPAKARRPDLAILIGRQPMELRASLMADRLPHLAVSADEAIGVVGPLVIPGRTACLRCLDLARTERDPAWPLILAQVTGREPDPLACDAPLAAAVAAQAAAQVLGFFDRAVPADAVTNGTLELVLPGWQWRRRTWPPHRDCLCGDHTVR
jgi:hypothetical protein